MVAFVWSSGLELWDPIILSDDDRNELTFLYSKTMFEVTVGIFKDPLNRYICINSF